MHFAAFDSNVNSVEVFIQVDTHMLPSLRLAIQNTRLDRVADIEPWPGLAAGSRRLWLRLCLQGMSEKIYGVKNNSFFIEHGNTNKGLNTIAYSKWKWKGKNKLKPLKHLSLMLTKKSLNMILTPNIT